MSIDQINREAEKYLQRNSNSMLPEEHFRARIKQFQRDLERVQQPLPMESGNFFTRKVQEQ
jgi:hypothetical protein